MRIKMKTSTDKLATPATLLQKLRDYIFQALQSLSHLSLIYKTVITKAKTTSFKHFKVFLPFHCDLHKLVTRLSDTCDYSVCLQHTQ